MLVLRSFQNTNLLMLLGGLLLCLIFMIQMKQIYINTQKYNRYLGYKEYVRLSETIIYIHVAFSYEFKSIRLDFR